MMNKTTLTVLSAATVFVLAGCSATATVEPDAKAPEASETAISQEQVEAGETLDLQVQLTGEEIVLEALMGPDGEYAAAASYLAVLELERLGVEVPENPYLGQIAAPEDLESAARAWAEGEVANVELYDALLAQTDDAQLSKVLNNLRSASLDSHLPAFEAAAANGGTLD